MTSQQRPVVVGVDGRPETVLAIRWGIHEARSYDADLILLHAYESGQIFRPVPWNLDPKDLGSYARTRKAEDVVSDAIAIARHHADGYARIRGEVTAGHPVQVLTKASREASALVIGTRRLGARGGSILGSVAAAVAPRASCPTVVVRDHDVPLEGRGLVVVGVDCTERSERVLAYAFDHASRFDLPLRVVLCWTIDDLTGRLGEENYADAQIRAALALSEAVSGWRETYPELIVERRLLERHPVAGLVEQSYDAELLVVGSHSEYAISGTLLGSVSQGVLHHAHCPVAVIPFQGGLHDRSDTHDRSDQELRA